MPQVEPRTYNISRRSPAGLLLTPWSRPASMEVLTGHLITMFASTLLLLGIIIRLPFLHVSIPSIAARIPTPRLPNLLAFVLLPVTTLSVLHVSWLFPAARSSVAPFRLVMRMPEPIRIIAVLFLKSFHFAVSIFRPASFLVPWSVVISSMLVLLFSFFFVLLIRE